jgi:hypothetical protein
MGLNGPLTSSQELIITGLYPEPDEFNPQIQIPHF